MGVLTLAQTDNTHRMNFKILASAALLVTAATATAQAAPTVFTYRSAESETDHRYDFDKAVLELALEKTQATHGDFTLQPSPVMNFSRAVEELKAKRLENLFVKLSAEDAHYDDLSYVPIPIDKGIVGYRVFFLSDQIKDAFSQVKTVEELKQFSFLQGLGWGDVPILEAAGFTVETRPGYDMLFPMVAKNRADVFPRGANELLPEYRANKHIEGLAYDERLVLYYPLPRFFFTSKGNEAAAKRVTEGLEIAIEDGSFDELWNEYYKESIDFLKLDTRTILKIENPNIKKYDPSFERYFYKLP